MTKDPLRLRRFPGTRGARRNQEEPGGARRAQKEPGEPRKSKQEPGGVSKSQEEPGDLACVGGSQRGRVEQNDTLQISPWLHWTMAFQGVVWALGAKRYASVIRTALSRGDTPPAWRKGL